MNIKSILASAAISAAMIAATALTTSSARAMDSINDWVLIRLNWVNGAGAEVVGKGLLPEFPTKDACQAALRRELRNHAGLSHADGGGGYYLCTHLRNWAVAE
jgi:hypothetical protein